MLKWIQLFKEDMKYKSRAKNNARGGKHKMFSFLENAELCTTITILSITWAIKWFFKCFELQMFHNFWGLVL